MRKTFAVGQTPHLRAGDCEANYVGSLAHAYQLGRKQRISIVAETIWPARSGEGTGVTSEVGWADVAGVALARA